MRTGGYYSVRTGKNPDGVRLDLNSLKRLFLAIYQQFSDEDYLQEAFGYYCTDAGEVSGKLGRDIEAAMLLALRKGDLWPISQENLSRYIEDDLFDVIEFLFDNVSQPVDGTYHSWNDCGWHYSTFDKPAAKEKFRSAINPLLEGYGDGFTLSDDGQILILPEHGMAQLLQADLPKLDPSNVEEKVRAATILFRRHKSSIEDRKHALRDLADVLEYLRPQMKSILSSRDESDLFNIANNFAIRHHNENQKTEYDAAIWCSWMFYFYLATIHACVHTLDKRERTSAKSGRSKMHST